MVEKKTGCLSFFGGMDKFPEVEHKNYSRWFRDYIASNNQVRTFVQVYDRRVPTTEADYNTALKTLSKFSIVLDMECLNSGLRALANLTYLSTKGDDQTDGLRNKKWPPIRDLIPNQGDYDYAVQQNQFDIKFYKAASDRSLVNCSLINAQEATDASLRDMV